MNIFEQAIAFWEGHGTKILGTLATLLGSAQTAALAMNAVDPTHPVVTVKTMILLTGATTFLSALTIKRGFTNSASQLDNGQNSGV